MQVFKKYPYLFLNILIFSILFWGSWLASPLISSDSLNSILKEKPLIVESIENRKIVYSKKVEPVKEYKGIPLLLSQRHSAVSFWPYIILNKLSKNTFVIWHYLMTVIFLSLMLIYLGNHSNHLANVAIFSPLLIFQYPFFISELFLPIIVMASLIMSLDSERKIFSWGILHGLGLLVRPNFLWTMPFIYLVKLKKENIEVKKIIKYGIGGVIGISLYLCFIDWNEFFSEVGQFQLGLQPIALVNEVLAFIIFDPFSVSHIFSNDYLKDFLSEEFMIRLNPLSYFLLFVFFFGLILNKQLVKYLLGIILFLILLVMSLKTEMSYTNYLYGILPIIIIYWVKLLRILKDRNTFIFRMTIYSMIINFSLSYYASLFHSPVSWHSKSLTEKMIEEVSNDRVVYTLGISDVGKYEYLSNGKVKLRHLFELVGKNQINSFYDVLEMTGEGTLILLDEDEWSLWPKKIGHFSKNEFVQRAKRNRFDVKIKIIESNERRAYIIRYVDSES